MVGFPLFKAFLSSINSSHSSACVLNYQKYNNITGRLFIEPSEGRYEFYGSITLVHHGRELGNG
jgi:hypothetical protein